MYICSSIHSTQEYSHLQHCVNPYLIRFWVASGIVMSGLETIVITHDFPARDLEMKLWHNMVSKRYKLRRRDTVIYWQARQKT